MTSAVQTTPSCFENFTTAATAAASSAGSSMKSAGAWCGRKIVVVAETSKEFAIKAFAAIKAFFVYAASVAVRYGSAGVSLARTYARELSMAGGAALVCALAYFGYKSCTAEKKGDAGTKAPDPTK